MSGNVQRPDVYVSDLLAFFLPSNAIHFTGNVTENDAYIGIPLLVLFAAGLVTGWHTPRIRWAGLMAVLVAVLSLGPHLHVNGNVIRVPLPWAAVARLPLLGSALPARLMAIGLLPLGIVVAYAGALALAAARPWRIATGLVLVAGLVAILPPLPYPSVTATAPVFFKPGGGVEKIPSGSIVLVTPFSSKESTDAMYWQALAGYRFRMPEGDAFTPGPYLGPHPSLLQETLDRGPAEHCLKPGLHLIAVKRLLCKEPQHAVLKGHASRYTYSVCIVSMHRRMDLSRDLWNRRSGRRVAVVPQLEREQRPELLAVVAPPVQVIVDQPLHRARFEEALTPDPLRRQDRQHLLPERAAEPSRHGDPEPLLGPVQDRVGQDAAQRAL